MLIILDHSYAQISIRNQRTTSNIPCIGFGTISHLWSQEEAWEKNLPNALKRALQRPTYQVHQPFLGSLSPLIKYIVPLCSQGIGTKTFLRYQNSWVFVFYIKRAEHINGLYTFYHILFKKIFYQKVVGYSPNSPVIILSRDCLFIS